MARGKDTAMTGKMRQCEKCWLWQQAWGPEFESPHPYNSQTT